MTETRSPNSPTALAVALIVPDAKRRRSIRAAMSGPRSVIIREFEAYPSQDGPDELARIDCDVVVVDLDGDLVRAVASIEDICRHHSAITVMAYTAGNDATLMRRSMQAGARELLVEPLLPESVGEAMTRAFARRPSRQKSLGKLLVFVPTKGGVGTTTTAANFALALRKESDARVVVVDLDFQLGQIALGLGMTAEFSVADAVRNAARLDWDFLATLLTHHSSGLALLSSPEEYAFSHLSAEEGAIRMFRILREEFDYVVVDSGTYHGRLQEALLDMADQIYLVTELTFPALRNAHRLIAYLTASDANRRIDVVVGRFGSQHADIDENAATKALGRPIAWRIPNCYAAARAAQANGVPLIAENSSITKALFQMAKAACGKKTPPTGKKAGGGFSFFATRQSGMGI